MESLEEGARSLDASQREAMRGKLSRVRRSDRFHEGIEVGRVAHGYRRESMGLHALSPDALIRHPRMRDQDGRDTRIQEIRAGVVPGPADGERTPAEPGRKLWREGEDERGSFPDPLANGIEVRRTTAPARVNAREGLDGAEKEWTAPAGSYHIPVAQPAARLVRSLLGLSKFDEALKQIASGPAPTSDPERVEVLALQAAAYRGSGAMDRAEAAYREALALEPSSSLRTTGARTP